MPRVICPLNSCTLSKEKQAVTANFQSAQACSGFPNPAQRFSIFLAFLNSPNPFQILSTHSNSPQHSNSSHLSKLTNTQVLLLSSFRILIAQPKFSLHIFSFHPRSFSFKLWPPIPNVPSLIPYLRIFRTSHPYRRRNHSSRSIIGTSLVISLIVSDKQIAESTSSPCKKTEKVAEEIVSCRRGISECMGNDKMCTTSNIYGSKHENYDKIIQRVNVAYGMRMVRLGKVKS